MESSVDSVKQVNEGLRFMVKELVACGLEATKEDTSLEEAKEDHPATAASHTVVQHGGGGEVEEQEDRPHGAGRPEEAGAPVAAASAGGELRAASAPQVRLSEGGIKPAESAEPVGLVKPLKLVKPLALVKHPLEQRWTFWHLNPDKSLSWSEKQRAVMTVATVEDFWATYNWILPPSSLRWALSCCYAKS